MRGLLALVLMTGSASAEHFQIEMIDARSMSVEQTRALAIAERENADAHSCCDWGGLGCRVETLALVAARMSRPANNVGTRDLPQR